MEIEKNVPIPSKMSVSKRVYKPSKWEKLEVGDSILSNAIEVGSMISSIVSYSKHHKLNWKITQRQVDGGVRIWRVK